MKIFVIFLIFPITQGGSLSDAIVKRGAHLLTEAELKDLLLQVSMGLKFIHSSGLVHLDIKPSMFCSVTASRFVEGRGGTSVRPTVRPAL